MKTISGRWYFFMEHIYNHKTLPNLWREYDHDFLREYIGKLNKLRSLFPNFKKKLFYFIEEQSLGYVLGFQGMYLESL